MYIIVQNKLDLVSSEDESVNRISSTLCILEGVACTSVSCERHVISRMISDVGNRRIVDSLVIKVRTSQYTHVIHVSYNDNNSEHTLFLLRYM